MNRGDMGMHPTQEPLPGGGTYWQSGLTIREHVAALVMQGLLVDGSAVKFSIPLLVATALKIADALIAELAKQAEVSETTKE